MTGDRCPKCGADAPAVTDADSVAGRPATYACAKHGQFWWVYEKGLDGKYLATPKWGNTGPTLRAAGGDARRDGG